MKYYPGYLMQGVHIDTGINPWINMYPWVYEQNSVENILNLVEETAVYLQLLKSPAVPSM